MRFGINRWYFAGGDSFESCLRATKEAGCDSLEPVLAEQGELTPETSDAELRSMARMAADMGVEISSIATGLFWKYQLTSADSALRSRGLEIARALLRAAEAMGTDAVLVVPGVVDASTPYDAAYSRAQAAISELAADAEEHGVHIGVENVWNKFLLSPLEFARFLDEIGHPYVGAYFDVGNVLQFGFPDQWIRILGKRIRRVHIKDFVTSVGNITGFCIPPNGDVPWERVRTALNEAGYNSYVTAEVSQPAQQGQLALKHLAEAMRALLG